MSGWMIEIGVLVVLISIVVKLYQIIFASRKNITDATASMAAMIASSMSGLIAGTALTLNHDFGVSCLLGMIFGIGVGIVLGMLCHAMAVLEGIMGGIMGGLMGAMTGHMMSSVSFIYLFVVIFMGLFIVVIVLLNKMINQDMGRAKPAEVGERKIIGFSILTASLTVLFYSIVMISSLVHSFSDANEMNGQQIEHLHLEHIHDAHLHHHFLE